jgi:hypothetical protein
MITLQQMRPPITTTTAEVDFGSFELLKQLYGKEKKYNQLEKANDPD